MQRSDATTAPFPPSNSPAASTIASSLCSFSFSGLASDPALLRFFSPHKLLGLEPGLEPGLELELELELTGMRVSFGSRLFLLPLTVICSTCTWLQRRS